MSEQNWDDSSKRAFILLLQTRLLARGVDERKCAEVLYLAMRMSRESLPLHILVATDEFLEWQIEGKERPQWFEIRVVGDGIAGY